MPGWSTQYPQPCSVSKRVLSLLRRCSLHVYIRPIRVFWFTLRKSRRGPPATDTGPGSVSHRFPQVSGMPATRADACRRAVGRRSRGRLLLQFVEKLPGRGRTDSAASANGPSAKPLRTDRPGSMKVIVSVLSARPHVVSGWRRGRETERRERRAPRSPASRRGRWPRAVKRASTPRVRHLMQLSRQAKLRLRPSGSVGAGAVTTASGRGASAEPSVTSSLLVDADGFPLDHDGLPVTKGAVGNSMHTVVPGNRC